MKDTEFIRLVSSSGISAEHSGNIIAWFLEYNKKIAERLEKDRARKRKIQGNSTEIPGDDLSKERSPTPPKEILSVFSSSKPLLENKEISGCAREREFFDAYNVCAKELGWTVARVLNKSRQAQIRRCIADAGDLEQAFDCLNDFANSKHGSDFGSGHNEREWVIDIDYVIRASKWVQIMEGKFNGVRAQGQAINGHSHVY